MRAKALFAVLLGAVAIAGCAEQAEQAAAPERPADFNPLYAKMNRAFINEIVSPRFHETFLGLTKLAIATKKFCAEPKDATYAAAKGAFGAAMDAWQHAQPLNVAALVQDSRSLRIQFWPDSGGSTQRQIARALKEMDPAFLAVGGLERKSVALQSLATYERLLVDNALPLSDGQGSARDRYACGLMAAIAQFDADVVQKVITGWLPYTKDQPRPRVLAPKNGAQDFFRAFVGTLDAVIQLKLERAMGKSVADAQPRRTENWRTGRSLANIEANLETLREMFSIDSGFADLLRAAGQGPLADAMIASFDRTLDRIRAIPKPLSVALTDPDLRPKIEDILVEVKALRKLSTGPVAEGIGLIVGFNALDGD